MRTSNDPMLTIFSHEVIRKLQNVQHPSNALSFRLEVVTACGPFPSDHEVAKHIKRLRAIKSTWELYIDAADSCGFLEGPKGNDLIRRLQSEDDEQFRSAMAECLACWFFSGKLKVSVVPRPKGRRNKELEFIAKYPNGEMRVEVKSPLRERKENYWSGNDSDLIENSLKNAQRQFPEDGKNLLCIALPGFQRTILRDRANFIDALFGRNKLTWQTNLNTGETSTPQIQFFPNGKFLRDRHHDGKLLKPDGLPRYTRVGGVLYIEEGITFTPDSNLRGKNQVYMVDHLAFILHNPYAKNPLPQGIWCDYPQFIRDGEVMKWTDGHPHQ